eukprot:2376903-Amphidinium_carterae.1
MINCKLTLQYSARPFQGPPKFCVTRQKDRHTHRPLHPGWHASNGLIHQTLPTNQRTRTVQQQSCIPFQDVYNCSCWLCGASFPKVTCPEIQRRHERPASRAPLALWRASGDGNAARCAKNALV